MLYYASYLICMSPNPEVFKCLWNLIKRSKNVRCASNPTHPLASVHPGLGKLVAAAAGGSAHLPRHRCAKASHARAHTSEPVANKIEAHTGLHANVLLNRPFLVLQKDSHRESLLIQATIAILFS